MHVLAITDRGHDHDFLGAGHVRNERRTHAVIVLTFATMVAEIAAGLAFGSMALLADGMHMATHAGALALSAALAGEVALPVVRAHSLAIQSRVPNTPATRAGT